MSRSREDFVSANLVCSSLRQRAVWASIATQLLQFGGRRWRETYLGSHDLALNIPDLHGDLSQVAYLLLLSPEDINNPQTLPRIQHLRHLTNDGHNTAALVFLLNQDAPQQNSMQPLMEVYIKILTHPQPLSVLPLTAPSDLPTTLQAFQSALANSLAATAVRHHRPPDAVQDLLPYCTTTTTTTTTTNYNNNNNPCNATTAVAAKVVRAGLSARAVEALSSRFGGFGPLLKGVATATATATVDGEVGGLLPEEKEVVEGVKAFWGFEFATS